MIWEHILNVKIKSISRHYSFIGGLLDLPLTMKIYLNYALLCGVMLLLHLCTTESRVIHLDNDDTDHDEDLPLHSITNGRGRNLLSSYNQSMYISKLWWTKMVMGTIKQCKRQWTLCQITTRDGSTSRSMLACTCKINKVTK